MHCCMFQGGNVAVMAADSQSVLGQAFLKYADALLLDDTNATLHFHVGRLLVARGDYSNSVARLETALHWNEQHQLARLVMACCYMSTSQHSYTAGHPSRNTSASTLRCTSSADHSATSSQHYRSSGIRCRWSDDVQHSTK